MIGYIISSMLAIILGQAVRHLIRRIPEIIEREDAKELFISTIKKDFKIDIICSSINLITFNLLLYFIGNGFTTYIYMVTFAFLQIVFAIDYKMQLIPDTVQLLLCLTGIINVIYITLCKGILNGIWYIIAGIVGGGIFYLLGLLGKLIFKKDSMGFGDVKLMATLGLIFGIKEILTITLVSFFISAIISVFLMIIKIKQMDSYIPFGPFIVVAVTAVMFTGYSIYVEWFILLCSSLSNIITEFMFKISQ